MNIFDNTEEDSLERNDSEVESQDFENYILKGT